PAAGVAVPRALPPEGHSRRLSELELPRAGRGYGRFCKAFWNLPESELCWTFHGGDRISGRTLAARRGSQPGDGGVLYVSESVRAVLRETRDVIGHEEIPVRGSYLAGGQRGGGGTQGNSSAGGLH